MNQNPSVLNRRKPFAPAFALTLILLLTSVSSFTTAAHAAETENTETLPPRRLFLREALRITDTNVADTGQSRLNSPEATPASERITARFAADSNNATTRGQSFTPPTLPPARPVVPAEDPIPQAPPRSAVTNLILAPRDLAGYVLGPNDLVAIKIYQEPDMDATVRVAKDGTIHYPPLGDLRLAGRTVQYASSVIREKLALDYLVNPQVAITVLEGMKSRFTILGEVVRPGIYDLPDEGIGLLEAIGLAGGFKPGAKRGRVVVTRMVDDRKVIRTVNADALATDADAKMFSVLPDDLITVKASFF